MPRRAARVDESQAAIVAALRAAGCSVQSLASVGQGVPDLAVARAGRTYWLECKTGKGKLTRDELEWILTWRDTVYIVRTPEQALEAVGLREESK